MVLSLTLHLPNLIDPRSYDLPEPVKLPGCVPVRGSDLPDSLQGRTNQEAYKGGMQMCKKYLSADGILVNDFLDLEPDIYKAFEEDGKLPPIYPVGPLVRSGSSKDNECLKWLDEQPDGTVLYVSFGSGGTLSSEQLKELALGLEMSEQRFLWVVKSPHDEARNATYFTIDEKEEMDRFEFLSTDFMNRTKGKGFLLAQWAPQIEILAHRAVGGFVTHCGWNSVLESIVHGVPIIAWPLFAEQRMNAVLLRDDLKVALRVRENEDGIVDSEQIAKLAKSLIKGKEEKGIEIRNRIVSLKGAAAQALTKDGYSTKSLAKVIGKWISVE
ncbi:hypothetical protein ACJIZ3_018963 [Penstemon smallii]|uniref:UDP-glycosyltransferases domain-containing protein n=1 Tax=Penstemon smallii TaxID=265156 RepID=A0ABD3T0H4_9LAMI